MEMGTRKSETLIEMLKDLISVTCDKAHLLKRENAKE